MAPVWEILLATHTGHVDEQLLVLGERPWASCETCCTPPPQFDYWQWNAKAGFVHEAYDYSRDLAIEEFHRLAARDSHPGPHAETQNVILVVSPTEREHAGAVEVKGDGASRRVQS